MNKIIPILVGIILLTSCQQEEVESNTKSTDLKTAELVEGRFNVALLVMEGTFNTELTAPMDIFHHTIFRDSIKPMNVFTVANTLNPITTFEGLKIVPDFDYTAINLPKIDILVIPAAEHSMGSDLENSALINFIKKTEKNADFVVSHCDGAFVLAKTGLLDGKHSTTYPGDIDEYKKMYPNTIVHEDVLFVHDGKFITSAGGAKAFEGSLYLCELLYGKKVADQLAEGMVIDWDLDSLPFVKIAN